MIYIPFQGSNVFQILKSLLLAYGFLKLCNYKELFVTQMVSLVSLLKSKKS
jgi:hypothetical protein